MSDGRTCIICGKPLDGRRRKYCSDECQANAWQNKPLTEAQEALLLREGFAASAVARMNRGEACSRIDKLGEWRKARMSPVARFVHGVLEALGLARSLKLEDDPATEKQIEYICHLHEESTGSRSDPGEFRNLTRRQASEMIDVLLDS